ncbi:hypothetical protein BVX97_05890 [bacterium E08(2017)]|nr:hypothetical protein BVX97_05890 [bacterium E08(2017)]
MEIKVIFKPTGREVHVLPGTHVMEAAGLAGVALQSPCGGKGKCRKCMVKVDGEEKLACRTILMSDSIVEVPEEALFGSSHVILTADSGDVPLAHKPRVAKEGALGAAFDIGTTTVVGTLFDLESGRELGVGSMINGQVRFGDDVISRIQKICEEPAAIFDLRAAIVQTLDAIISKLCMDAGVKPESIRDITVAGNAAMQQIFCGHEVAGLSSVPFEQSFHEAQYVNALEAGITSSQDCEVYVFPQLDGFVGGDTVAGILAARMDARDGNVLFVDIGTNGEIVLKAGDKLFAASTAAGPAFEGARIKQGMRAVDGAIEKVVFADDVQCNVIGDTKPLGLCGTALIDAISGLLDVGIVDATGRLLWDEELPDDLPTGLKDRVVKLKGELAFVLADGTETSTGRPVCIWQKDVRELQLAAGAIRAGVNILLNEAGLGVDDLDEILLAGAFGNFIRRNHACRIGLLPDVERERIKFVGNAASLGAKLALLSVDERDYAARLNGGMAHVDLSKNPGFQDEFAMAMMFPNS